jgi:hypothetical protein
VFGRQGQILRLTLRTGRRSRHGCASVPIVVETEMKSGFDRVTSYSQTCTAFNWLGCGNHLARSTFYSYTYSWNRSISDSPLSLHTIPSNALTSYFSNDFTPFHLSSPQYPSSQPIPSHSFPHLLTSHLLTHSTNISTDLLHHPISAHHL